MHRFDAYTKAAEQFTASQAVLLDTQTAAAQIDRVLQECVVWVRSHGESERSCTPF